MKIHRHAKYNSPRSRRIASMEQPYGANVMYNPTDGAVIVMKDDNSPREYWVRLSPLECDKLFKLMEAHR